MMIAATVITRNVTSPYIISCIGVLGVVVGAVISAVAQSVTARNSSRAQATALQLQLNHQTQEVIRQQRLRVYSDFLMQMDKWQAIILYAKRYPRARRKAPGRTEEWDTYRSTLRQLDLLASERLSSVAYAFFSQQGQELEMLKRKRSLDKEHTHGPDEVLAVEVVAAMQAELDVLGAAPLDPATGLRNMRQTKGDPLTLPPSS